MTITALSKTWHADTNHPRYLERLGSAGIARSDVEVRVVDADDHDLPPSEIGEVLVRGDVVMRGYWQNPQASAEALRGGWLHTGDLGTCDADGFLTLKDRSKDMIISGGSNIGYLLKAGQLEYDCHYSKMHGMPVPGGRGFRGLKPLWYNGVPP